MPISSGSITFDVAGPFETRDAARSYLRSLEPHVRTRLHVAETWPGVWYVRETV